MSTGIRVVLEMTGTCEQHKLEGEEIEVYPDLMDPSRTMITVNDIRAWDNGDGDPIATLYVSLTPAQVSAWAKQLSPAPAVDAEALGRHDKWAIAWVEWWMSHHEKDRGLGGTLQASLTQLRDIMARFDIPRTPIDDVAPQPTVGHPEGQGDRVALVDLRAELIAKSGYGLMVSQHVSRDDLRRWAGVIETALGLGDE